MKPLEGVRVVDLTRVLAGPFCSLILADLGAEVIKVEAPEHGDDARGYGPFIGDQSAYFMSLNRNKKSVTVDLKSQGGREALSRLLESGDVLLENYRPGTLDKLGFAWARLQAINRRLICCHISGFGQTGPYRERPAYDIIVQSMGGIMSITGQPGGAPTRVGTSVGDIAAALYATIGILAALRVRDLTGQGQEIDVAMLDCQVSLLENAIARYAVTGEVPAPIGNRHPSISPFAVVPTEDGYIAIAAGNDVLWRKLCDLLQDTSLTQDDRFRTNQGRTEHWPALEEILHAHFRTRRSEEWLAVLQSDGIPCGPVNDVAAVLADPQVRARGMLLELDVDGVRFAAAGNPIKFSLTPAEETALPPPKLGEHNAEIFADHGLADGGIGLPRG